MGLAGCDSRLFCRRNCVGAREVPLTPVRRLGLCRRVPYTQRHGSHQGLERSWQHRAPRRRASTEPFGASPAPRPPAAPNVQAWRPTMASAPSADARLFRPSIAPVRAVLPFEPAVQPDTAASSVTIPSESFTRYPGTEGRVVIRAGEMFVASRSAGRPSADRGRSLMLDDRR
jgi:hypothetical protein